MWQMFIMIPFLGFAAWMYMRNMKKMKDWEGQNTHFRAGEFAQRLGMQLVEGDPTYNLATAQVQMSAKKVQGSEYDAEFHLRMVGQTYGHPTELAIEYTQRQPMLSNTIYTTFFGGVIMQTQARFGRFEIYRRVSTLGAWTGMTADAVNTVHLVHEEGLLPKHSFGDPTLDERYVVAAEDPNLVQMLRPVMNLFQTMDFVHIVGQPGSVMFKTSQLMQNLVWMRIEEILYGVACTTATLEGQPMPAMAAMGLQPGAAQAPNNVMVPPVPTPALGVGSVGPYGQPPHAPQPPMQQGFSQPPHAPHAQQGYAQQPPMQQGFSQPPHAQQPPMQQGYAQQPPMQQGYAQQPPMQQGFSQPPHGQQHAQQGFGPPQPGYGPPPGTSNPPRR